ncbi:MAG: DUF885 family protein [Porticoccaceae bacterium]
MTLFLKALKYLLGLVVAAALGAYIWFWAAPVGLNNYINKVSIQMVLESPETMTSLGLIDNTILDFHSDKLGSYTDESNDRALVFLREAREGINNYGPEGLEGQELLSWKITAWFFDDILRTSARKHSGYPINQISGVMVDMPQFLTDQHLVKDAKSASRYVSRLNEFARVIGEMQVQVAQNREHGNIPPDFIIEKALSGMRAFSDGDADSNPLVSTFQTKLAGIDGISQARRDSLVTEAHSAVADKVIPAYKGMIGLFEDMAPQANHDAGIWRLPDGDKIYIDALQSNTTTTLTADEIHELGLSEVARIEAEMEAILVAEGYSEGSFVERVQQVMALPEHNFPNTDEGRVAQIAYLNEINDQLMARVSEFFITIPPQPLEILRVAEYAQDSSPGGYYMAPALDGSVPGRFYINQKNTEDNPRWTLPTLMYHEGAPGHHFQISASQLIEDVPFLRKMSPFSAYTEGWALYAERMVVTDMDIYADYPLGNLGRLQAEIFRAVRLVVDTGMHAKKWSREQAISYMLEKTGMTEAEVTREIERYVVWPGQATAYKVGQLALLKLRATAEAELGEKFDVREFHEMILSNGAMPLEILEESVNEWIAQQQ